jgi:hypothetical protein
VVDAVEAICTLVRALTYRYCNYLPFLLPQAPLEAGAPLYAALFDRFSPLGIPLHLPVLDLRLLTL